MNVDIPTALSDREAHLLRKLSENRNVLEVGSLLGFSTVNIAKSANRVISIDPHENYPYIGAESTLNKFMSNLLRYGIYNVEVVKDTFQNSELPEVDMCFADLDGTYETTKQLLDFTRDIPLVVVHDFNRQNCLGVEKAIKEFSNNICAVDTCAIIRNIL